MAENLKAGELPLSRIFSSEYNFFIPSYQRPYSWSVNEAGTLFDDLYDFWKTQPSDQTYFLGSIVLVKKENDPIAEVIDGQQRLTTLTILLAALSKLFDNTPDAKSILKGCLWEQGNVFLNIEAKPRLKLRERDADFFTKYILNEKFEELLVLNPKTLTDSQRMIQANAGLMQKNIADKFKDAQAVSSFVSFILKNCYLVAVTTPNKLSAFRVFSVLNNRGMSLLPCDIIKANVIGKIEESKQQKYTDKWDDVEETLGRDGFNAVFSHIRMIYAKSKSQKPLVEEFEQFVMAQFPDAKALIDEAIDPFASAYNVVVHAAYESANNAAQINSNLRWLNKIDDADWIPATIMAVKQFENDDAFLLQFTTLMERLASAMYLTSKTSNYRIERHSNIISALESGTQNEILQAMQLTPEEKNLMMHTLNDDVYHLPARKRTYAITRLDSFVSDNAFSLVDTSVLTIEHVLPQTPAADSEWLSTWPDADQRTRWTHRIANLIPLTRKKNSQAQNFDFQTKKEKYFTGKFGTTTYALATQILGYATWTPDDVIERQKHLLKVYSACWDLDYVETPYDSEETDTADEVETATQEPIDHNKVRAAAAERINKAYNIQLVHQKDAKFVAEDFAVHICSAGYSPKNKEYWYSLYPEIVDWMKQHKNSYVAFAMGTAQNLLLFNVDELTSMLPYCRSTLVKGSSAVHHYHFSFVMNGKEAYFKRKIPERFNQDVSSSLIEDIF